YDYLTKPEQMEKVDLVVRKAAEKARLRRENGRLRACLERQEPVGEIVTADPAMKELVAALERVAGSDLPVLIEGEGGTGKELLARVVHRQSPRAEFRFVALRCMAAPDGLAESELFGNEKNLCELADGG